MDETPRRFRLDVHHDLLRDRIMICLYSRLARRLYYSSTELRPYYCAFLQLCTTEPASGFRKNLASLKSTDVQHGRATSVRQHDRRHGNTCSAPDACRDQRCIFIEQMPKLSMAGGKRGLEDMYFFRLNVLDLLFET